MANTYDSTIPYKVDDFVAESNSHTVFVSRTAANLGNPTGKSAFWTPAAGAGTYDVTAFGAKGNGTDDDSMAIQNAIAAASVFPTGGVVVFPPGRYRCVASGLSILADSTMKPDGFGMTNSNRQMNVTLRGCDAEPDSLGSCILFADFANAAPWLVSTTYAAAAQVLYVSNGRTYQSIAGGNIGNLPTDITKWTEIAGVNTPLIKCYSRGNLFENLIFSVANSKRAYAAVVLTKSAGIGNSIVTRNTFKRCFFGASTNPSLGVFTYHVSLGNDPTDLVNGTTFTESNCDFTHFEDCTFIGSNETSAAFRAWSVNGNSFANVFERCHFSNIRNGIWMRSGTFHTTRCGYSNIVDPLNPSAGWSNSIATMSGACSIEKADVEFCANFLAVLPSGIQANTFSIRDCRFAMNLNPSVIYNSSYRKFVDFRNLGPFTFEGNNISGGVAAWSPSVAYALGDITGALAGAAGSTNAPQWAAGTTYAANAPVYYDPPAWTAATAYAAGDCVSYFAYGITRYYRSITGSTGGAGPLDTTQWTQWTSNPRYYYSLVSGNLGKVPTNATFWAPLTAQDVVSYVPAAWSAGTVYVANQTATSTPMAWNALTTYQANESALGSNGAPYFNKTGAALLGGLNPTLDNSIHWSLFSGAYYSMSGGSGGVSPATLGNTGSWRPFQGGPVYRSTRNGNLNSIPATQGSTAWTSLPVTSIYQGATDDFKLTGGAGGGNTPAIAQWIVEGNTFPTMSWWEADSSPTSLNYANRAGMIDIYSRANLCSNLSSTGPVQNGSGQLAPVVNDNMRLRHASFTQVLYSTDHMTAVRGISASNTKANNLVGSVTLTGTTTSGTVAFAQAELDASYVPIIGIIGISGAATTKAWIKSVSATSFDYAIDVAPGGTNTVTLGWHLIRKAAP
jgi:hypothetical protein